MTNAQIIKAAKKMYQHGKYPDIMVQEDDSDTLLGDVTRTDDGTGAWVLAMVWVPLESPAKHRNGRLLTTQAVRA